LDIDSRSRKRQCSDEIDLHGLDAEEALFRLDLYLNEAFVAGLPGVRVVHGKGLGTLRHVVRELLTDHPLVGSFRPGESAEGGAGVTMVELENR
jgi:DNA mismatch repair protein MutS2